MKKLIRNQNFVVLTVLNCAITLLGLSSCTPKESIKVVQKIEQNQEPRDLLKPYKSTGLSEHITSSAIEVQAVITFNKSKLFNREFLYGADLQHSSIYDQDSLLFNQVYTMGHELAFFRKQGSNLQLVIDQSWKFESDVNKPERLLNEFNILAETAETITVEINKPSHILRQMFWGNTKDITRGSWLRSVEFDPQGEYLLMESSVETMNGDIVEHMESLFPRENLISKDTKAIFNSEDEPLAQRFKFLSQEPAYQQTEDGRIAKAAANRFNLNQDKQVNWYVTRNIEDDILADVKTSVEGWNRYFQHMWGKDGFHFAGKLPENVKLGDPRYNVIVWDNVQDGDAAYESQAADPMTGIQSHSNIYIPFSWLKTASEYWENAQYAEIIKEKQNKSLQKKTALESKTFLGRKLKFNCYHDLTETVLFHQKSKKDLQVLAREVLKGVIFHEVGHALGLDHNFKGSLVTENGSYTSSIMDYNHYNLESSVFTNVDSSEGPLLEYDRQILDVLYNNASTIKDSKVLPSCNDVDADATLGGVDPVCNRYDAGANPYQWLTETQHLIEKPIYKLGLFQSLSESLNAVLYNINSFSEINNEQDFEKNISNIFNLQKAQFNFYFTGGAHSLRYLLQTSLKSLKNIKPGVLDNTLFKESDIRQLTLNSLNYVFDMNTIPQEPLNSLNENLNQLVMWTKATPYFQNLNPDQQSKILKNLDDQQSDLLEQIQGSGKNAVLTLTRARILTGLTLDPNNSYYYSSLENIDAEKISIHLLKNVALTKTQGTLKRSLRERLVAINSLLTFQNLETADEAIHEVKASLQKELNSASNSDERDTIRKMLKLFK